MSPVEKFALIEFTQIRTLHDANLWAAVPVLEVCCTIDTRLNSGTSVRHLKDALSELILRQAQPDCRDDLLASVKIVNDIAGALVALTLGLQKAAGCPLQFGATGKAREPGAWRLAIEFEEEVLVRDCLNVARTLCLHRSAVSPLTALAGEIERLRDVAYFNCLGESTRAVVAAAKARGIPVRRLGAGSLLQLGHGARQRRVLTGETDRTGAIAETIAQDKELTRSLLKLVGVPVPRGRPVQDAEDAWRAAQEFGVPVVIKPRDANHGRGVSTDLTTETQVHAAYDAALKEGDSGVLLEEFVGGDEYRLLVIDGRVVAAARREPAQVRGDGRRTIWQLVEAENRSPLRGDGYLTPLKKIEIDAVACAVLAGQGYTRDSVPADGVRVFIRRNINFFNGGTATDVTRDVHPDVAICAVQAARMIGLDIAGIDLKVQDIGRSLEEQRGAVLEVNAGPGLQMHLPPSAPDRPVAEAIIDYLFGPKKGSGVFGCGDVSKDSSIPKDSRPLFRAGEHNDGRIPIVAVFNSGASSAVAQRIADVLATIYNTVGLICADGDFIGGRATPLPGPDRVTKSRNLLLNPAVDAAVIEIDGDAVQQAGFGFDRCTLAVFCGDGRDPVVQASRLRPPGDGRAAAQGDDALVRQVAQRLIETVDPAGTVVFNADNRLLSRLAFPGRGNLIVHYADEFHPRLVEHCSGGGRAVFLRGGSAVFVDADAKERQFPLAGIPQSAADPSAVELHALLAALAAVSW